MSFTVRALTHQAGLHGFLLSFITDVTEHLRSSLLKLLLKVLHNLSECCINLEMRSFSEFFITDWAETAWIGFPAFVQAGSAEVVSTWSGDWIIEHIQTDGALELLI